MMTQIVPLTVTLMNTVLPKSFEVIVKKMHFSDPGPAAAARQGQHQPAPADQSRATCHGLSTERRHASSPCVSPIRSPFLSVSLRTRATVLYCVLRSPPPRFAPGAGLDIKVLVVSLYIAKTFNMMVALGGMILKVCGHDTAVRGVACPLALVQVVSDP